jgi:hypothetical protein
MDQNLNKELAGMLDSKTTAELEQEYSMASEEAKQSDVGSISGKYSLDALKKFIKTLNSALSTFGVPAIPEPTQPTNELPPAVVGPLTMIASAISDAVSDDVLDESLAFDPESVVDDMALNGVGISLTRAFADKAFKRWLKEAPSKESEEEIKIEIERKAPKEEMSEEDMDNLFASRM